MKYGANTEQQLQKNNKYSERTGHNCKNHIKPVWNTTGTKKKKKKEKLPFMFRKKRTKRRSAYWQTSPHQIQLL